MIAQSLRRFAAAMEALAAQADEEHPIDGHDLIVLAKQVSAQAEMLEQGLEE